MTEGGLPPERSVKPRYTPEPLAPHGVAGDYQWNRTAILPHCGAIGSNQIFKDRSVERTSRLVRGYHALWRLFPEGFD